MTTPYDQDTETPDVDYEAAIAELQAEVEDLRVSLLGAQARAETYAVRHEAAQYSADYYKRELAAERARHENLRRHSIVSNLVRLVLVALFLWGAFALGVLYQRNEPACHSVTEDSTITDCDYRDGGWYPDG